MLTGGKTPRNNTQQSVLLDGSTSSAKHISVVVPHGEYSLPKSVSISWAVLETSLLTKLVSTSTRLTYDLLKNMLPQSGMEQELRLSSC